MHLTWSVCLQFAIAVSICNVSISFCLPLFLCAHKHNDGDSDIDLDRICFMHFILLFSHFQAKKNLRAKYFTEWKMSNCNTKIIHYDCHSARVSLKVCAMHHIVCQNESQTIRILFILRIFALSAQRIQVLLHRFWCLFGVIAATATVMWWFGSIKL